ncbi:MAG: HlyD family efflux transporter periplasmic adaptor subunit [Leptolyngbya sp. SIO1D8]|nr:HlyD family efflux transporter periplasmic adaptor subunit [Leptolyngbya sp. SIO1D8]
MAMNRPQISIPGKSFWLLIAALLFVGGVSFFMVRSVIQSRQAAITEETAAPPPQRVQVVALGRVEPAGRVVDVVPSENGRLNRVLVKEGDPVEANQVLAYLDIYDVRLAERDYAASQLTEAQTLLNAETAYGEASIQEAQTRVEQIDQPQLAAIEAQQNTIDSLQAELEVEEIDLIRFEQLHVDGAIAKQELDRQQATVNQLREDILSAQARKQELEASRDSDMANATAQVQAEEANLALSQAQVTVNSAAQNLALAEARLAQTIIRAPSAGQILKLHAEPGEAVTTSNPILALGNTDQMYVVAEVYETDVTLIEPGQRAIITSRNGAFEDALTGVVEEVGLQIFKNDVLDDDPAANADARVVEVRVRVDQSGVIGGLTNLQVDVAIDVES